MTAPSDLVSAGRSRSARRDVAAPLVALAVSAEAAAVVGSAAGWAAAAGVVAMAAVALGRPGGAGARLARLAAGALLVALVWGRAVAETPGPTGPAGTVTGVVEVRGTPVDGAGGVGVEALAPDGEPLFLWAPAPARATVAEAQPGDRLAIEGRASGAEGAGPGAPRVVVGTARLLAPAPGLMALANRVHRLLGIGAAGLAPAERGLLSAVVLGDDRDQDPEVADAFRRAGLSHLLVVSGQNVAFVLTVAGPVLRRLGLRGRTAGTIGVLWVFALVTRFEPSVLRAVAMAGLASMAWTAARPLSGVRLLAAAVVGLVVVDPLIAASAGFQLSVAATAGIVVLAPWLQARLPGPAWLRAPLAVTLAAQVAVAPLLARFDDGGVPVAAIPANLLAVPVAGPLTAWGLTAGLAAGALADGGHRWGATVLHLPTRALLGWLRWVAVTAAGAPVGAFSALSFGLALVLAASAGGRTVRHRAAAAGVLAITVPALPPLPPVLRAHLARPGLEVWATSDPDGRPVQVVVLDGRATDRDVLRAVRALRMDRVVLIRTTASPGARTRSELLSRHTEILEVLDPPTAGAAAGALHRRVGELDIELRPRDGGLAVTVTEPVAGAVPAGAGPPSTGVASARAPPRHGPTRRVVAR